MQLVAEAVHGAALLAAQLDHSSFHEAVESMV